MQEGTQFSQCLLEQKDEASRRARRIRRLAFLLSILIQAAVLTFLVFGPLFVAAGSPVIYHLVPAPPRRGQPGAKVSGPQQLHTPRPHVPLSATHAPIFFPQMPRPVAGPGGQPPQSDESAEGCASGPCGELPGDPNGLLPGALEPGSLLRPSLLLQPAEPPRHVRRSVPPDIQQAKLIHRVEPQYPAFARQARLEGTVQLRAVIARDGTVQSLEVLGGNPIFVHAAREAIIEWRYQPTRLNGEAVEVETLITVVFRLN
jgi:protein TonB